MGISVETPLSPHCRVFGQDTVPWCAEQSGVGVPNNYLEKEGQIFIPLVMVNTGTQQKFDSFRECVRLIRLKHSDFVPEKIVWSNDILPGHKETEFVDGCQVAEEKGLKWWEKYAQQKIKPINETGNGNLCFNKFKCWRFPRIVFSDVRVSWNGSGRGKPRIFLNNLMDELREDFPERNEDFANDQQFLQHYLRYRVINEFNEHEQAVIHLDPGISIMKMVPNGPYQTIDQESYMLAKAGMEFSYSLPSRIFGSEDFWEKYFKRITEQYGSYKAVLSSPMGLRLEHVLAVAEERGDLAGGEILASVPDNEYGLTPVESLGLVARGFHPSMVYAVFKMLERSPMRAGLKLEVNMPGRGQKPFHVIGVNG